MLGAALCIACLLFGYYAGRRSLVNGLLAVLAVGYAYGIVRANLHVVYSHFTFDAAIIGLYISQILQKDHSDSKRTEGPRLWMAVLIAWPLVVCFLPFQDYLVTIAGLRANILVLPGLWLGARLRGKDLVTLAGGLAILNLGALAFAGAEFFLGVERFFPMSEVTAIILSSSDVGGGNVVGSGFLRIPSTFVNSAAYGGTMVLTLPLLYAAWCQRELARGKRFLLLLAMLAAFLGILLGASRSHFIVVSVLILASVLDGNIRAKERMAWVGVILILAAIAMSNERFQRFQSLADKSYIADRIGGSVNRTFFEILAEYPMGHGLGSIGIGVPFFLQNRIKFPIVMESEYARIVLEEGLIGLVLWIAFIFCAFFQRSAFEKNPWVRGRRLAWFCCLCYFGTGLIGTGLLTSIPQSLLLFLLMGWITAPQARDAAAPSFARNALSGSGRPLRASRVMQIQTRQGI